MIKDWACITSLGILFHCVTTLIVKKLFPLSNLNLSFFSIKLLLLLLLVLLLQVLVKRPSLSFLCLPPPLRYWKASIRSPKSFLFFKLNNSNSLRLSSYVRVPSLLSLLWPSSGLAPIGPHLCYLGDPGAECSTPHHVSLEQSRGTKSPSSLCCYIAFDAAQDTAFCNHSLPVHVQFFIHQLPEVLLYRPALNPFIPQPQMIIGIFLSWPPDFAL